MMSRASQLGPHKFPYVAPANSKEHEVQVTAARRGGRVGRACGTAGPRTSPFDARENFPYEKTNEHESNSPRKARRPARGERLRFLEPDRRRTGPIGVGSARRPGAAIFASSIPYLDVSGDSLAARERRRRGHAAPLSQLMCPCLSPVKTSLSGRA